MTDTQTSIDWGDVPPVQLPDCFEAKGDGPFIWVVWDTKRLPAHVFPTKERIPGQKGTAAWLVELMEDEGEPWPQPVGTLHVVALNPSWDPQGTSSLPGVEPPAKWLHSQTRIGE